MGRLGKAEGKNKTYKYDASLSRESQSSLITYCLLFGLVEGIHSRQQGLVSWTNSKLSDFGTGHFDIWDRKETGNTFLDLCLFLHDNLSSNVFTFRDITWVAIYCKSEIKMHLIIKRGWVYLRVSSAPDTRRVGICLLHSNIQGPGPARGSVSSISGPILSSMWQTSVW